MKRFHVHVSVADLNQSVQFYSQLFGQAPARQEGDYAKWMLDDPRINFAISTRSATTGVDHFGVQVDSEAELAALRARACGSGAEILDEGQTQCCYAVSDKHWVVDPQGVPWEHFVTMGEARQFGTAKRAGEALAAETQAAEAQITETAVAGQETTMKEASRQDAPNRSCCG